MSKRHKFKQFMKKKNLNPMNNRKKVGIIYSLRVLDCSFYLPLEPHTLWQQAK